MSKLSVEVLGPLQIRINGAPIVLAKRQAQVLISLLAAHQSWVSEGVLIEGLWPDRPPRSPQSQLHVAISRLRATIGDDEHQLLERGDKAYRLTGRCEVDLRQWQEDLTRAEQIKEGDPRQAITVLARARDLWRGRAFETTDDLELLERLGTTLENRRAAADLLEAELLLQQAQPGSATLVLEPAVTRDPLRQDLVMGLMTALARCGRTPDALAVAARYRTGLRDELGLSPSEEFETLESELLGLVPSPALNRWRAAEGRRSWRQGLLSAVRARVEDAVVNARHDVVVITAEPRQGLTSFLSSLHGELGGIDSITVSRSSSEAEAPSLRTLAATVDLESAENSSAQHVLVADHVGRIAADVPFVLIVDDAHRLDDWSLGLLTMLGRVPLPGLVVIAGVHPQDSGHVLDEVTPMDLGPLELPDVEQLLAAPGRAATDATVDAERILSWSGGEVDATQAAVAAVLTGKPLSTTPARERRLRSVLGTLDATSRQLLEKAAVLGDTIDPVLLAATTKQPPEAVAHCLSSVGSEVAEMEGTTGRWRFVNGMTRETIASRVGRDERAALNLAAARVVQEHDGDRRALARLLHAALPLVPRDEVEAAAADAAAELAADGDHGAAAEQWLLAMETAESADRRVAYTLERAGALEWSGRVDGADELRAGLMIELADSGDYGRLAEAALGGGGSSGRIGGQPARRRRLSAAWRRIPPMHDLADEIACEYAYELWAAQMSLPAALRETVERVGADARSPVRLLAQRLTLALADYDHGADLDQARQLVTDALDGDGGAKNGASVRTRCLVAGSYIALSHGAWSEAEAWIDELQLVGEASGEPRSIWQSLAYRAALLEARGATDEATETAELALEEGAKRRVLDAEPTFSLFLLSRGLLGGSLAAFAGALEEAADRLRYPVWYALRGLAALDAGKEQRAAELLDEALDHRQGVVDPFKVHTAAFVALLAARLGRAEHARAAADALSPWSGRLLFLGNGGPFVGPVDWYRGVALQGIDGSAAGLLDAADLLCDVVGCAAWSRAALRTLPRASSTAS